MKCVADESVDAGIVQVSRQAGHEVMLIAEMAPSMTDAGVLALANDSSAPLVTADKDFGELVFRQRRAHAGVLLIRLYGLEESAKAALVVSQVSSHGPELPGAFSVLTQDALRIRPKLLF